MHVLLHGGLISPGVQEPEEPLDDRIEVREKSLPLDAFAEVDKCSCGMGVDSEVRVSQELGRMQR